MKLILISQEEPEEKSIQHHLSDGLLALPPALLVRQFLFFYGVKSAAMLLATGNTEPTYRTKISSKKLESPLLRRLQERQYTVPTRHTQRAFLSLHTEA
jgi:hypothetical protein